MIEAEETLADLELQRQALAERLEQLIRSRLYLTNASYSGIQLTREAAAAARKNLDLVTDSYSRGVVDVLDLLDAQNSSLRAELAAATALYEFFINLVDVERAVNWFEVAPYTLFYLFAMVGLGLHLSHGLKSACQTFGINHPRYTPVIEMTGFVLAIAFGVGFGILPIWSLTVGSQL